MLYPTINQGMVFVYIFICGTCCGLLFDIINILLPFFNENKIIKHIFQFFATFLSILALFLTNLYVNFGQFRFYVIASYIFAIVLERTIIGKLILHIVKKVHQKFLKLKKRITPPVDTNSKQH